jgi:ribosomal protein S18 acetylase RimI-like enzyme
MSDGEKRPAACVLFPEQDADAARALGRAFIHDPPLKAILPEVTDPSERARRLTLMFEVILAIQRRSGQPVIGAMVQGRVAGVGIIEGAGKPPSSAHMILAGIGRAPAAIQALGVGGLQRSFKLLDVLARNHPREPHIYLNFLGVDPDFQRRHHCGGAILEHLRYLAANRADVAGVYLETATEANVAYYHARGYEVTGELFPLGVRMWQMFQRKH